MKSYYHFTSSDRRFKEGEIISVSRNNYYYEGLVKVFKGNKDIIENIRNNFRLFTSRTASANTEEFISKLLKEYQTLFSVFNQYLKLNRENIYENVRQKHYTDLPSRTNCIWLIDDEPDLKYWDNIFNINGKQNRQIFEVDLIKPYSTCKCSLHSFNLYLEEESKIISQAHDYWQNRIQNNGKHEILYKGKIILKKELIWKVDKFVQINQS